MLGNHESLAVAAPAAATRSQWLIVLRRSDESHLEHERQLQLVLGAVSAGTWEADFVARRLIWSPELFRLHGLDSSEPLAWDDYVSRVIHPEDRVQVVATLMELAAGVQQQRQLDRDFRIIRPDGQTIWMSAVGGVEQLEAGKPVRAMGIIRDISLRKRAELAQQDVGRFIARITEVAPTLIYVYDIVSGRSVYNNAWLPQALGYDYEPEGNAREFIDRIVHPDDQERLAAYRRTHPDMQDGIISHIEYRVRDVAGSWHWLLSRNQVFARNEDGSVRELIGATTDITSVKQTEEELRRLNVELERRVSERTADLAAANRELEAFAYSVSHDLRGPLRAIGGFSNAVLNSYSGQLDADGRRYLSLVTAGVKHMADMIEGLLALSRTTRDELLPERVDLSMLAREVLADLQSTERDRQVDITIAPHAEAVGDARLLRVALDNLLGNAWKYTSRSEHPRIEFGTQLRQGETVYYVRDNGAGFNMNNAAALFTPFQRLHSVSEFEGTGIGLATVQRIVHRHGGRIWAQSAPNQGATFYFTLANADTGDTTRGEREATLQTRYMV